MICKQCNKHNEPSNAFCVACGNRLTAQQAQEHEEHEVDQESIIYMPQAQSSVQPVEVETTKEDIDSEPMQQASTIVSTQQSAIEQPSTTIIQVLPKDSMADKLDDNATQQTKACKTCNTTNFRDALFCIKCGTRLELQKTLGHCHRCGVKNLDGVLYCNSCGINLNLGSKYKNIATQFDQSKTVQNDRGKGLSIAGFVLGIVAISVCVLGFGVQNKSGFGLIVAIVGIILSSIGLAQSPLDSKNRGKALTGLICACIGFALFFVSIGTNAVLLS